MLVFFYYKHYIFSLLVMWTTERIFQISDIIVSWCKPSRKPNSLNDIFHQKLEALAITQDEKDMSSLRISSHLISGVSYCIALISPYWTDTMPIIYSHHFFHLFQGLFGSWLPIHWLIWIVNSLWVYIIRSFLLNNYI